MATNQNEYPVPAGKGAKRRNAELLPRFYRTDSNKKFIQATIDQLTQPGAVKKINGYIGRQNAKSSTGSNIFVESTDSNRQNYQLEPSLVVKDTLNNVTFYKDYIDYINQLGVFGANTSNHARLNQQEFYSWNPHIDWDKFVNFQQYYWLPQGPSVINLYGQQRAITSTYTVQVENEQNSKQFLFTPNGLTRNPTLKLYRGQTYHFEIDSQGEPFSIKTSKTTGASDRYTWGIGTTAAVEKGTITFKVPDNAPNLLFYISENDVNLGGIFKIYDIKENTAIDVDNELIGKKTYTLANGTPLSNGMKIKFRGNVTPEKYATDYFYVEGVGSKITLVAEKDLEIISSYNDQIVVPFDDTAFDYYPFDIASSYSNKKDYITINRASKDRNPWSRYNRWFHKDVIDTSAAYNGQIPSLDQTARAIRPIIEFEAGLKLFNFGLESVINVDLIDTFTTDAFSTIEGSLGYSVDGIQLINGHRVLFANDTDSLVKNKVFRVTFVNVTPPGGARQRQIHLVEESSPELYQTVLVKYGVKNQGQMYWYNGSAWQVGQQKTAVNQPPLFDVFDLNRESFSNTSIYEGSTFKGTKLFSYAVGLGSADTELGFALTHKNINNVGDIVFNFNLLTDTFIYKTLLTVETVKTDVGSLIKADGIANVKYVNGWEISNVATYQPVVRIYRNSGLVNNFDLDVYDDVNFLNDLEVRVYVNGRRLDKSKWTLVKGSLFYKVVLDTDIALTDVLTIKSFTSQAKNANGYYEIPINLQNNPLNNNINNFTLGEVIDHVDSIIDNITTFSGEYPGANNLRDIGGLSSYGTKFVQHSGALPMAMYHITDKNANIIKALQEARDDYGRFKREFILLSNTLSFDGDVPAFVDAILEEINKNKPTTFPYYFSDMVPYGAATTTTITVVDYRIKTYPLSSNFNVDKLSPQAVLIYVNGVQLTYGIDYTFDGLGFAIVNYSELANDDIITIVEYDNTDGSFVPATPTKLGLWPKYEPIKYLDTTLVTPQNVIQGHDGSITLAYDDYRDDLLLEVEKRIFNNIKVSYDTDIFDVNDYTPRYCANNDYSLDEFNEVLASNFYQWTKLINRDFTKPLSFDRTNSFTFNYRGHAAPDGRETPGYWRGIYRWLFDTDRPHIAPWEMLGYSIMPTWWEAVYGPAPYTSDNEVLWQDLSEGIVREPNKPIFRNPKYIRPYLLNCLPVNENGELVSPYESQAATGIITNSNSGDFVFGDISPVEAAWRRSSYYAFSMMTALLLTSPASVIGKAFDRSRIYRDLSGQIVYKDTGVRTQLSTVAIPNIYSDTTRVQTAGLVNYLVDYIQSDNLKSLTTYKEDMANLTVQLAYRVAGFTEKEKFNLLLDSKNPTAVGGVFVPQENYSVILNTSSPVNKLVYSGVIITKLSTGFEVKGYSINSPYFHYYPWDRAGYVTNVGGISETFSNWTAGQQYVAGKIVNYSNAYYRVKITHTAKTTFDESFYQKLSSLPITGGRDAYIRTHWDKSELITIAYGTKFRTIQEVVDFLLGYGEYLKDQGFVFDNFNNNLGAITNWVTSAKEFLFWTTQNWSTGEDRWVDWLQNQNYVTGTIVAYNGDYYEVLSDLNSGSIFDTRRYKKLSELSTVGASVLAVSPAADGIVMNIPYCVVDDVRDHFNGYEFFKPDGTKLEPEFLNSYREDNNVVYSPASGNGIYGATFYLVQKEHIILLDNTTLFNDTIYEQTTGYRQEKIKVSAYVSTGWYGGFDIPGFIYDQATVSNWAAWTDYNLGDVVKYKEFYYSASSFLPATETFDSANWIKLAKKPTSRMIPNWSYKAEQFTDFYSLDSDNFDTGQQKMAQHLIGYQKRQYLENIIKDDISEYKFYQGMIIEKGTQNVLNKLFDVLSAEGEESVKFFEEWAVRVGSYGSSKAFEEIEFELDEALFKLNPQPYELVNAVDQTLLDFVVRQTPNDLYLKPLGYANEPWPVTDNFTPYLRTPGFVRIEDVKVNLDTLDAIVNEDITDFTEGDYVWCAFEGRAWNVYRLTKPAYTVSAISYNKGTRVLTVTTSSNHGQVAGGFIGITGATGATGFYKIFNVTSNTITVSQELPKFPDPNTIVAADVTLYVFTSQHISSIDTANDHVPSRLKVKELLWSDDDGTGKWTVYQNNKIYVGETFNNSDPAAGLNFGKTVAINRTHSTAAIANNRSEVLLYDKAGIVTPWVYHATINLVGNEATVALGEFGRSIDFSPDGTQLVIGTPLASNVFTKYKGTYNGSSTYAVGDIVKQGSTFYTTSLPVPIGNTPGVGSNYWTPIRGIPVNVAGTSSGLTNQGLISLYKKDGNGEFVLVKHFVSPAFVAGEKFGSKVKFIDDNTLYVTAQQSNNSGKVYQFTYSGTWGYDSTVLTGSSSNANVGYDIAASDDGSVVIVSAPGQNKFYLNLVEHNFGIQASSVAVSGSGKYFAVGCPLDDTAATDSGAVFVYSTDTLALYQTIFSRNAEPLEQFGSKIAFMNDAETLVIYSALGDSVDITTQLASHDSGRIDIYDMYSTKWIYGESITYTSSTAGFGNGFAVAKNYVLVSAPSEDPSGFTDSGAVYSYQKPAGQKSWTTYRVEQPKIDLPKIKKVFLYNKRYNELVTYLDIVDPLQGNFIGVADQELKYKTYYDPATYSVGTTDVNVDDGMAWLDKQVGMLWWDMRTAKFIDPYNGDVVYRSANWNTLYETASIDVYEWVETTMMPSAWDKAADTVAGLTNDISGKSLYGDNVYSVKKRYDNVAKAFKNIYYFWVKNKTTVPSVSDRSMSARDVAKAIADPKGEGYQYIAFTGPNSFSLVNVKSSLVHKEVNLAVEYWTIDDYEINSHSQWRLISNDANSSLPASIEAKLIDSLCGKDQADRVVPDFKLPLKLRFGIENRPRQSMFVNRFEALKQYIERVNSVLQLYTIVEDRDISKLHSYEKPPSTITGLYDVVSDTDAELRFIGTSTFKQATLTPTVIDGKIVGAVVVEPGLGYLHAPYIDVIGAGQNAKVKAIVNSKGQVTGVNVENSGEGYVDGTILSIRSLAALVKVDSGANGNWSIYTFDTVSKVWSRTRSQSFDVSKYWTYTDWYATGYNQFNLVDFVVDATYLLPTLTVKVGQLVKVKTIGTGGWVLLEKYADVDSVDYTQSYKIVGREKGTIQFLDNLYRFANTNLGFDGPLFDGDQFDNTASQELRIILGTIKDNILIDDLKQEYLNAFFATLRYAFSEQTYIDWAFKTSFVRAQHNVGPLKEKVTYNNDNLQDFEAYVNEVKPYRTKVREFVSSYSSLDNTQSVITDFDIQSIYTNGALDVINTSVVDGKISADNNAIISYPWRHWYDNVGFKVTNITIVDKGSNYISNPIVKIISDSGTGAVATAYVSNGKLDRIDILSHGTGYLSAPTIIIDGGLDKDGVAAKAIATIGDSVVRSNLIKVKFDRVSSQYYITNLQETETFTATGSQLTFNLKWAPRINVGDSQVTVDGVDALNGTYQLGSKKSVTRGYTSYSGTLQFTSAPAKGTVIKVSYIKDFYYLSAADRINWYYNPATGEIGKDIAQLMTGVDYGGVQISGLGFSIPQGWGSLPWFTDQWDALDPTFDDYIVVINGSTPTTTFDPASNSFVLPYTPDAGEQINVYFKSYDASLSDAENAVLQHIRLDDLNYSGATILNKEQVVMQTWVGDGVSKTITLPRSIAPKVKDSFIFRKSTSDGSVKPQEQDYDTALSGGDLAYSSASGIAADDIIVDGDGLVTANTSHGPEEVVPGQVVDTLAVKVKTRPTESSAAIKYNNYIYDGSNNTFDLDNTPNSAQAVLVLFSNLKRPLVVDRDFTVDYAAKTVSLITTPTIGAVVSVISFSYAGTGLQEIDYFIADGKTAEFITGASWDVAGVNAIVYVNGLSVPYELFKTDTTYDVANLVGIRFTGKIAKNSVINYVVFASIEQTFSVMKSETFVSTGATTYTLKNKIGESSPMEASMLVYTDQDNSVYTGPSTDIFTIENNQLVYAISPTKVIPYSVNATQISVLVDGVPLKNGIDYLLDLSGINVTIKQKVYNNFVGKQLTISINSDSQYTLHGDQLTFGQAPDVGVNITVLSFYKHEFLGIQRSNINVTNDLAVTPDTAEWVDYFSIFGKTIKLDRSVLDDSRVWVVKNGKLLQHSVDYKLNPDLTSVHLADEPAVDDKFTVITFDSNIVRDYFEFMQFKDVLNRTHFKRLSKSRRTMLALPLHVTDTTITVDDDRVLGVPNPEKNLPGIIEIHGERIEYFIKTSNVLSQLRRGTLGTGVRSVYPAGTEVQDIGITETIPYKDEVVVEQLTSDGTSLVYDLKAITPAVQASTLTDSTWYRNTIPTNYGQSNDIDVFVGGYDILGHWAPNVVYAAGDIVVVGSYNYRCVTAHTSSTSFVDDHDKWTFFIGNIRLKKVPYKVHNTSIHYESPEGDVQFEADFSVTGLTPSVRLTNNLTAGTKITVVKKTGRTWEDSGKSLANSVNVIANFIKADVPVGTTISNNNGDPFADNDGTTLEL